MLVLRYESAHQHWFVQQVFDALHRKLVSHYPDVEFTWDRILGGGLHGYAGYYNSPHVFQIVNPETGAYSCVSYWDTNIDLFVSTRISGWDCTKMKQLITVPGNQHLSYLQNKFKNTPITPEYSRPYSASDISFLMCDTEVIPFTYGPYLVSNLDPPNMILNPECDFDRLYASKPLLRDTEKHAIFRGFVYGNREYIKERIANPEIKILHDKLPASQYLDEMINSRCVISLNGMGEICNRDLEAMALGIPLIRPTLMHSTFHDPLIPNYHYIAVDYDRQPSNMLINFGDPLHRNFSLISEALEARWEEVKDDIEYLEYVGNNAREWYVKNGTLQAHIDIFIKLFDISKLQESS